MSTPGPALFIRKLILFSLAPLLSAIASLIALPVLTSRFGADGWAAVAFGISVGSAASVVVELGWGLDGPVRVAGAGPQARRTWFALSLATKLLMFLFVVVPVALAGALFSSQYPFEGGLSAISGAALGFTSVWYFVGVGSPLRLVMSESVPKVVAALSAAALMYLGGPLLVYPVALILGALSSPIIASFLVLKPGLTDFRGLSLPRVRLATRGQLTALRGRAASAVYLSLPTALLGVVSPSSVSVFAAADRLQRMALTFLQILPNTFIGWANEDRRTSQKWKKVKLALAINTLIGLTAGIVWFYGMPLLARVVFAGKIDISNNIVALSSLLILTTVSSRAVGGIGLIAFRGTKYVSDSAILGAILGICTILLFGALAGAQGAFWGLVVAELAVLGWQIWSLIRIRPLATDS